MEHAAGWSCDANHAYITGMESPLLIVMRHAKTEFAAASGDDFSRALMPRGTANAHAMGRWLHARYADLTQMVSSTAMRTRQTVAAVSAAWGDTPPPVRWEPALYLAELDTLLGVVEAERQRGTLLVGHNPGLEDLVRYLLREPERSIGSASLMPTSAVYVLELPSRRARPAQGSAVLRAHMRPQLLAEAGSAAGDAGAQR